MSIKVLSETGLTELVTKTKSWTRSNFASARSHKTTMDATAQINTDYYLGTQTAVSFTLPTGATAGEGFMVLFYSGSTAAALTVTGDCLGEIPIPTRNQRIKMEFLWDGTNWVTTNEVITIVVPIDYLCFTANTAGSTVAMSVTGTPTQSQSFEYSTDRETWETFTPGTTTITLPNVNSKVYFKGDNTTVSEDTGIYYQFVMTGSIAASGDVMSLLDPECELRVVPAYCFRNLFASCTSLTTPPKLLATTLGNFAYSRMFYYCTNMTVPKIYAAIMGQYSCYQMFQASTSIKISTTQDETYKYEWRIPASGTGTSAANWSNMMLEYTKGSFTGAPTINTTYYSDREPI